MIKKPKCTDDLQGQFSVEEVNGKTAFVFETMPAVLYISTDGKGSNSFFFRHGEHMSDIQALKLQAELGKFVTYELDFNAVVKPE